MGVPQTQQAELTRVLQQSAETRMRAIEEKISIAFTFCTSVELEIQLGKLNRANYLMDKLDSAIDRLTAHINHPAHVSDKRVKQKFQDKLAVLRQRVSRLHSEVNQAQSANGHNA